MKFLNKAVMFLFLTISCGLFFLDPDDAQAKSNGIHIMISCLDMPKGKRSLSIVQLVEGILTGINTRFLAPNAIPSINILEKIGQFSLGIIQ